MGGIMVEKTDIKDLAVAAWRLEKWLNNLKADRKMAAKSALRIIKNYLSASGIEIKDPTGARFDPGLAIEVINNESEDAPENELIVSETLSPYIYQDGELVQRARVIIGTTIKHMKDNNEIVEKDDFKTNKCSASVINNAAEEATEKPDSSGHPKIEDCDDEAIKISKEDIERVKTYAKIL